MELPAEQKEWKVTRDYRTGNNLLNFLPTAVFYGQRPSVWWSLRHDIDLLIGTYKYGYANYSAMRTDRKLCFYETEKAPWQFNEFPYADNITRRLKKLVQIFGKPDYQVNLCFEKPVDGPELTFFTKREKEIIIDILSMYGLPVSGS